jgi:hypothetical protein
MSLGCLMRIKLVPSVMRVMLGYSFTGSRYSWIEIMILG